MSALFADLRHAARTLARSPAFTAVVVTTVALGIGANTALFSVVDAVLLRPLPYADARRLAVLWEASDHHAFMNVAPPTFLDWREQSRAFRDMAAFSPGDFFLAGDEETVRVHGARATSSLFATLGVAPALGRGLEPEDEGHAAGTALVLSDRLWRARFGADPSVLGRAVVVNDRARTVVGVMPPGFDFPPPIDLEGETVPRKADLWVPFDGDQRSISRGAHFLVVVGRLAAGMDHAAAEADLRGISDRLAEQFPATNAGWTARVVPFEEVLVGDVRRSLWVLLAAVGAVLLIACLNIANMLLARGASRGKEYAIRAALGAGRGPLLRHALAESQLLAIAGGAAGIGLGYLGTGLLVRIAPTSVPRLEGAGLDLRVLAFALVVSVLTGLLFGLVPALRALAPDLAGALRAGGRGAAEGESGGRLRSALVVSEVALSLALLVAGGLLLRSFLELRGVDVGLRSGSVLTAQTSLSSVAFPARPELASGYSELERRVASLPGVEAAGFVGNLPLTSDYQGTTLQLVDEPPLAPGEDRPIHFTTATPGYFPAMGIPLVDGRAFTEGDDMDAPHVALVNQEAARRYFGGRSPIGRQIVWGNGATIVGVVGDVRLEDMAAEPPPIFYVPQAQFAVRTATLAVRSGLPRESLVPAVRDVVRAVDRGAALFEVRTMDEVLADAVAKPRFASSVLVFFSAAALLLAALGLYGLLSYSVGRRRREIGVRMALGATPRRILSTVTGEGLRLVAIGVTGGSLLALAAGRGLQGLLFGVRATDPATLLVTSGLLLVVALAACLVPAARATRVEPVEALREE